MTTGSSSSTRSAATKRSPRMTPSASTRSSTCTATRRSSIPPAASTAASTCTTVARTSRRSDPLARRRVHVTQTGGWRVLIVEDDLRLGRTLVRGLREAGFAVEVAPTGEAALGALLERPADVVMLDVVLPGIDGFETCRRLRETDSRTPVVMLSARGGVSDRVAGL